jgi:hypothetical protein
MIMKYDLQLCIYNDEFMCSLSDKMHITSPEQCEDCIILSLKYETYVEYKKKQLQRKSSRYKGFDK